MRAALLGWIKSPPSSKTSALGFELLGIWTLLVAGLVAALVATVVVLTI